MPIGAVIPEGHEDISVQLLDGWIHAQAKSRRSHRGRFSISDIVDYLEAAWSGHSERAKDQPNSRLVLVLETGIQGLNATGWQRTVSEVPPLAAELRPPLQQKLDDHTQVEKLLSTTSIVILAEPRESSLSLLSERLQLPMQVCTVHFEALKSRLTELADDNGVRSFDQAARLTATDSQRLIYESTEIVDVESLNAAIRDGICEVVDFQTPLQDPDFYQGVDVKPGHIVAGLTIHRQEVETEVIPYLESSQAVLITGPSGAGKSAAVWMAAHSTRHLIRWYRVRRLTTLDVPPLLRLIRAIRPTDRSPVGFVADDLGASDRDGWDALVAESANLQGVCLLGAVREEDLLVLQSAYTCNQVRLALDEALGERLWNDLRSTGSTAWEDWREPYELAESLLLEYGYLLTTGERLGSIITSQIDRRVREGRDLELRVLRYIAAADVWGVGVELDELRKVLGQPTDETLQRALARLLDEHLVQQASPGVFSGLHRVRSQHVVRAIHRFGTPSVSETISTLVSTLGSRSIQPLVAAVLSEEPTSDAIVLDSLSQRLKDQPDPQLMISALQGLRIASFVRLASGWTEILAEENVSPSRRMIAAQLALAGVTNENFAAPIQAAIARMTTTLGDDLRLALLRQLGEQGTSNVIQRVTDIETATLLLSALVGIPEDPELVSYLGDLDLPLDSMAVDLLAQFLSAARAVDVGLACHFADQSGGTDALLRKIELEMPWVGGLRLAEDEAGQQVVEGTIRHVSATQIDVHGQVVELCRLALSCAPEAVVADCKAVDASGATSGYNGLPLAEKRIPRANLPSNAEVAWARARGRAIAALLSAQTRTERLVGERSLLVRTATVLSITANKWCREQRLTASMSRELQEIVADADALPPPPLTAETDLGPLDQGELELVDPASALITGVVQAANRLFDPNTKMLGLAAYIHDTLLPYADSLVGSDRWRLLSEPPQEAMLAIQRSLVDLHAVVAESHYDPEIRHAATRRSSARDVLARCALVSRERAERRLLEQKVRLLEILKDKGVTARIFSRSPHSPSGPTWPFDEVLLLVELGTLLEWAQSQEHVVSACREVFEPTRIVVAAPVRDGRAVSSLSGRVQSRFYPLPDEFTRWASHPEVVVLDEVAAAEYVMALQSLVEMSAILGDGQEWPLLEVEASALDDATDDFFQAVGRLHSISSSDGSGLISESIAFLESLSDQVRRQRDAIEAGQHSPPALAISFLAPIRNQQNQTVITSEFLRLALLELDVNPNGVTDRIDGALQRLTRSQAGGGMDDK